MGKGEAMKLEFRTVEILPIYAMTGDGDVIEIGTEKVNAPGDRPFLFHRWDENTGHAIIERPDGMVMTMPAARIKFTGFWQQST